MSLAILRQKGLIGPARAPPVHAAAFPFGLGEQGLHEVADHAHGDRAAATGFVLAAARRVPSGALLWIAQDSFAHDAGRLSEAGLIPFPGRSSLRLNLITRRAAAVLWAVEEAVASGAVSHVMAELETADFTATRRLTLASSRHGVPVTLLLPYTREGATAAATRWRIRAQPSAANPYDAAAPGHARWRAVLERARTAPDMTGKDFDLEWNDETLSLNLVSGLAAGQAAAKPAGGPAAPRRLRAG
ncbi:MAG: ImuA family protein [Hyphomonas sp.]